MTLTPQAQELLTLRGIDLETAARYQLTSVRPEEPGEWVSVPYHREGVLAGSKQRPLTGQVQQVYEGSRSNLWNGDILGDATLDAENIVICQDEFSALAAVQSGMSRVVAMPTDSEGKAGKFDWLDANERRFTSKEIVLAVNGDDHGRRLMSDIALRLGKARCRWIPYPLNRERTARLTTLSEVLGQYGEEGVIKCFQASQWVLREGVYSMDELAPIPEPKVHRIGFPGLDEHFGIRKGDFCVVTGIPSHGKSSVLNDIACRMVANHNWRVAFASFEQPPQTDHRRSLRAWFHGEFKGSGDADKWIKENFRFIVPSDDDLPDLEWALLRCEMAAIQHQCEIIVLDPWNELDHARGDMSLTEYTGYAIKKFKRLATRLGVFLVIAAHPAKMKKEGDKYLPPTLYDISDSAHWYNKADIGMTVYRPNIEESFTQLIINKVRYQGIIGKPGVVDTQYLYEQRRYQWADKSFSKN